MRRLTHKRVRIFVKEQVTFIGEGSAMASLLLNMMGALAEFERELIRERQREGIALSKQRSAFRGRARSPAQITELRERATAGVPKTALAKEYGISWETVYAYLRAASVAPADQ